MFDKIRFESKSCLNIPKQCLLINTCFKRFIYFLTCDFMVNIFDNYINE